MTKRQLTIAEVFAPYCIHWSEMIFATSKKEKEMDKDVNDVERKDLNDWKVKENNDKKQPQVSTKEPIDLDAGKRHLFTRKAASSAVILLVCTATSVVWMVGPLVAFSSPRAPAENYCSLQPYKGTFCHDVFENYTFCVGVADAHTFGSSSSLQYLMEVNAAQQIRAALQNDTKCELAMMSVICWSAFNVAIQTTNRASTLKIPEPCTNDTVPSRGEYLSNDRSCSKFFYYDNTSGLCKPTCAVTIQNKSIINGLSVFGIFGCIVAFVTSVFNYKVMCKFPSILLIYWLVFGVVYFISDIVDCCTTSDYFENYYNPSPLCQLKGFLSIFLGYILSVIPLEHTIILFGGVWFPYFSKNFFSSTRRRSCLHAFALLTAFVVPGAVCVGLIAAYATGSISDVVQYYYAFVPLYGVYGVIAALVGMTAWKLIRSNVQTAERHTCSKCCTPEFKLSAVFIYVVILFGATIVRQVLETYRTYGYVDDYFLCETDGTEVCALDPDHFNGIINAFVIFHNLVFSLSPYVSLIYIMPVHLVKQKLKRWRSKPTVVTV